ncbi:DUF1156 domain-containing protein [Mesorhizobium sp. LHD-90]|uniref:DUF1156 domain-containing protein n=1 Tax=Mesorhizobium sp. LHD-90 TaxID=3071414 RepID=UPI0027E01590|nr:DUF1156 domain-containing protein [Mesorhizobium sp. LHD-90]MDQ6436332.1 DUF1156 domain-containing protein [Mesorhizobium sp. LHD-90]
MTYKKKLIEVAIPLEAINKASAREKSIRHGHPSTLHLWWARRPLAACRAVLFAQLVDDPSGHVDDLLNDAKTRTAAERELNARLSDSGKRRQEGKAPPADDKEITVEDVAIELERKRLFDIIEELVIWENSTNEEVLERARAEIRKSCGGELPPIYDPFSGGGSIPLEAQRLGLPAYGSDLNPVAVMIGKAMIEIPPKFKDMAPVHPGGKDRNHYRNAEGLAEDVLYYGEWMREKAFERIGHLYPQVDLPKEYGGGKATVIAWIWARTVPSPDPAFASTSVPLISNFVLSNKKGKEVWIEPSVDRQNSSYSFSIRSAGHSRLKSDASEGTKTGDATFQCLLSKAPISATYIDDQASKGNMGRRLIAVIAEGAKGKVYLSGDTINVKQLEDQVAGYFDKFGLLDQVPNQVCRGTFASNAQGRRYGFTTFSDYFTPRQLLAMTTLTGLVPEVYDRVLADASSRLSSDQSHERLGSAQDYARAICTYVAFSIDRLADAGSSMATWAADGFVRFTYARQGIAMTWDFAECNPFSDSTGNVLGAVEWVSKAVSGFAPNSIGSIVQADAQSVSLPPNCVISTDPPYYSNISYADLSDYFYIWLQRSLKGIIPDLFSTIYVPKIEELIADKYRHGGEDGAKKFFQSGMSSALHVISSQDSGSAPAAIYYAFKKSEIAKEGMTSSGWTTFLQAVLDASYQIVRTWPVRTERSARTVAFGTNALANAVVLVCRRRAADAGVITRAEFIRSLKRELPDSLVELQAANIAPADLPQSSIGPGIGIFSRYDAVLESDDSRMSVTAALQLINRELDEYLGGIEGEFDADTRLAISWFEQFGTDHGPYGTADNIARGRGISVESAKHAGILESSAGKVRILKRDELPEDWNPAEDKHLTVWECCQQVVRALETGGEYEAAVLLRAIGPAMAENVKDLAYCLYNICEKRKDAKEATSYNALIAVWSDLTRLAASSETASRGGQFSLAV